jgi:hypothetical protein
MIMNYAIIKDGAVINLVIWDGGDGWSPPEGTMAVEIPDGTFVDTGYGYLDGAFSPTTGS